MICSGDESEISDINLNSAAIFRKAMFSAFNVNGKAEKMRSWVRRDSWRANLKYYWLNRIVLLKEMILINYYYLDISRFKIEVQTLSESKAVENREHTVSRPMINLTNSSLLYHLRLCFYSVHLFQMQSTSTVWFKK